jgi:probable rRNA maturation factor
VSPLEVEVLGDSLPAGQVERACVLAAATAGVEDGHLAVAFVSADEIAALNAEHRGRQGPTDVLSFPVDGAGPIPVPPAQRELGDVVICPEHTDDLAEAVVHGVLHLVGMDHETDEGEMLALQAEVVGWLR